MLATPSPTVDKEHGLFEHYAIEVDPGQELLRIDKFLMDRLPHTTRNKIQLAIAHAFIRVNQQPTKASYKVRPNDQIQVVLPTPPRLSEVVPEALPLDIVYEDDDLLLVNKPAGMVVHPAYNNWTGTLVNALAYHFAQLPTLPHNEGRPGLVHRIDKDTSGLLVIAKTEASMTALAKQFYDHTIQRTYYALVWGEPTVDAGTVDIAIGRSPKDRRVMATFADATVGKHAITHYQVVKRLRYVSLIQCQLETGRTHQIRTHMKHLGHPIFNDAAYGGDQIVKGQRFSKYKAFVENCFRIMPRQALHAQSLGFVHPTTQQSVHFETPLPLDFQQVLDKWERYICLSSYLIMGLLPLLI
ncbi:MAG: RluA family pseudouridine synthase [Bacteroidota bacterium]